MAAGNTCVVKPAEDTPLSTLYVAHLAREAGIPDGVINVVPGLGETAGAALSRNPDICRMSFTGSPEVGRLVAESCGRNLVPVKLELGGKGATGAGTAAPGQGADDPALVKIHDHIKGLKINRDDPEWKLKLSMPPRLPFSEGKTYYWHMVTNVGEIAVKLMPTVAPMHVSSTVFLAESGYYDNIKFHRVIPGFMAQGGCPVGDGRGHPGYKYNGEFDAAVTHDRHGLLSMANAGPGTDGSQFFLTFGPTRHLDGKHTIFGEVTGGRDTLDVLEQSGTRSGRPTRDLEILESYVTVE